MKRRLASILAILILSTGCISYANDQPTLIKAHATAYCLQGITATGKEVRKGICATGHSEWLGKTCILYQRLPNGEVGEIIGYYEIEDTGCKENVIDVWCPDLDSCQEFMDRIYMNGCKGKVFLEIVDAQG